MLLSAAKEPLPARASATKRSRAADMFELLFPSAAALAIAFIAELLAAALAAAAAFRAAAAAASIPAVVLKSMLALPVAPAAPVAPPVRRRTVARS